MRTNLTMLVRNRPRLTKQALETIGHHDELLVLDDCSNEETKQVLQELNVNVYALGESRGTGFARNKVIEMSKQVFGRGDYLYLSDNDVVFLDPQWLETLIDVYEESWPLGYRVVGAYNHPFHIPVSTTLLGLSHDYDIQEVQALALQSMLMRWEVWEKYGPFKETPPGRVCMGEDVEFGWAIAKDGGKLGVVSPALLVNTGITNSFGEKIPGWELVKSQAPEGVYVE